MDYSKQFHKTVFSYLDIIKSSGKPVIIFGTGRAGWYIMKVFEYYKINISYFCSNKTNSDNSFFNYPVLLPEEVSVQHSDALIFLGVFLPNTANAIKSQLEMLSFKDVISDMATFLYIFFIEVVGRQCDNSIFAKSIHILFENYKEGEIHYGSTRSNHFVSPFVTSVITQKCSLRCRDCAQFIPYYKKPLHYPIEIVVKDIKRYAEAFDVVPEISLHGGEPFLHPQLKEICQEVSTIPNIIYISFITNGTLLIPDETLNTLSKCGADVHQSGGYGSLSKNQDKLVDTFNKYGIYNDILFCSSDEMWMQYPPYEKHSRSISENYAHYKKCVSSKMCCQIMDGELHRCALSMHGSNQGMFPKCEDDYVKLHSNIEVDDSTTIRIRDFLNRDYPLNTCDYCNPDGGMVVTPAIQLQKIKPSKY